jgi:hypothetical protein
VALSSYEGRLTFLTEENARLNSEVNMLTGDSNALTAANIRIGNLSQENDTLVKENQSLSA